MAETSKGDKSYFKISDESMDNLQRILERLAALEVGQKQLTA